MSLRAFIFDLDDTLALDECVSSETFTHVANLASSIFGANATIFTRESMRFAQDIWASSVYHSFCNTIGISAFECLWGEFTGEYKDLSELRHWTKIYRVEVFSKALEAQGVDHSFEAGQLLSQEFSKIRRVKQRLSHGARELITKLAEKYDLALLTNGAVDLQREKIETLGISPFFKAITISGEYGIGKPHPDIFHRLLDDLGISAREAMMVGNSLQRDIMGAKNVGIRSIWIRVQGSEEYADVSPDYTIQELLEIFTLLPTIEDH